MEKAIGNVLHVGIGPSHPEVKSRYDQVLEIAKNLTETEIMIAKMDYASAKYHRLKQGNDEDFRASGKDLKNISGKT